MHIIFREFKFNNFHITSLAFTPIIIYVFNSGNYPNFIMYFFQQYGDKFQFIKGSDVLIAFIFSVFILKDKFNNEKYLLIYVNLLGSTLLPLFLTLSRASFFLHFFFLLFNFSMRGFIRTQLKTFFIFIGFITIFILSSIRLASLPEFRLNSSEPLVVEVIQESVSEVVERKIQISFWDFIFVKTDYAQKTIL